MRIWVEAARPRTLPAAVVPVAVGTAAATRPVAELDWARAALALVVALALQVAVNYANDYFDGVTGVDTERRAGPRRAVATGLVAARGMLRATVVALAVAAVAGLALAVLVGWELLAVGALAIVAALGYSGGRRPYASRGWGEVSVFVFFGLVATVGSQYVQDGALGPTAVAAALPVGLVATALLVVNNLRDIPTDAAAGKRTLAVRLGEARTRRLFEGLLLAAIALLAAPAVALGSPWPLLALVGVGLAARAMLIVRREPVGPGLVGGLEATAAYHLAAGALLTVGLAVGGG